MMGQTRIYLRIEIFYYVSGGRDVSLKELSEPLLPCGMKYVALRLVITAFVKICVTRLTRK